jgi:dTDP-4-dehydrorhamnose reductase
VAGWPRLALHDAAAVRDFCAALPAAPIIIYCDAVCDVAKCEENPAWAREINIGNLQRTIAALPDGARLVYVSSDHVFGDDGSYDENSAPCPVSRYGASRAEAERLALTWPGALVIRAGLPIGDSMDGKSGHRDWLCYRLNRGLPVTIVEDESRTAMPLPQLADRIVDLAESDISGIRHISSRRLISRPHLAAALKMHFQLPGALMLARRVDQGAPHLGRIHIITRHTDELASPLPCPLELLGQLPAGHF